MRVYQTLPGSVNFSNSSNKIKTIKPLNINPINYQDNISFGTNKLIYAQMKTQRKNLDKLLLLFEQLLPKNKNNFYKVVEAFRKYGMTADKYLVACAKFPQTLALSPDKIENKVLGVVEKYKNNGLTIEKYLKACLEEAPLFYTKPETVEKNINGMLNAFGKNGLTVERYLEACMKVPKLLCHSHTTLTERLNKVVERFEKNGFKNLYELSQVAYKYL